MIDRIAAPDDPRFEPYSHLADHAWLRGRGLFVAEGRLVLQRLVALGRFSLVSVLVNEAALRALHGLLADLDAPVLVSSDATLRSVTGFNFHRGCVALAVRPAATPPDALRSAGRLVALEGVGNPDNVGGIFRTAAALGAGGILLGPGTGDPLYRKAIRTSMAAALSMPFTEIAEWPAGLNALREHGFRLVALTPQAEAVPLAQFAAGVGPGERLVLLLGSEGGGLDPRTLALADARVRIPLAPGVDSLNVVVAAGIALDRLRA